ncbi:Ca2+-binding RTX toxin-like protein [Sphingomonas vulcanisoli]|uniref:Ca2+-binding RTX toxin-like protein n=1 Tax=Sphingomonas vulcanisoli TaxID=1658060 RepID=A0ABX0TU43_9SPHN|nr:FG-GAP-like repeat-containing protein [Sphingomonas vulcanisoli]NIJ09046.1 Ca2+-binding RTX toxin-like protein [Sphingomonas vulcanisoli]
MREAWAMTYVNDRRAILSYSWVGNNSSGNMFTNTPVFITYSFEKNTSALDIAANGAAFAASFQPLTDAQMAAARTAFSEWDAASGVTFLEAPAGMGDIKLANFNFDLGGPYRSSQAAAYGGGGIVFVGSTSYSSIQLFAHEIGHNLGFKHSFEGDYTLAPADDNYAHTVMSYSSGGTSGNVLGSIDLDAISYLYGAPGTDGNEDQSWTWNAATATLTQLGLAAGTTMRGVGGNNIITGQGGDDNILLTHSSHDDTIDAGAGNNTITLYKSNGAVSIAAGAGLDTITLQNSSGPITIAAGDGDNKINAYSATGSLNISAGSGADSIYVSSASAATTIAAGDGKNSISLTDATGNLNLRAGSGADYFYLSNNSGAVTVTAGDGANSINVYNQKGLLNVTTGNGADYFYFNNASGPVTFAAGDGDDSVNISTSAGYSLSGFSADGGAGKDTLSLTLTDSTAHVISVPNPAFTGFENINLTLGSGADVVTVDGSYSSYVSTGDGNDIIRFGSNTGTVIAGAGNDIVYAGSGSASYYGGTGTDLFVFGSVATSSTTASDSIWDFETGIDTVDLGALAATAISIQSTTGAGGYLKATAAAGQFQLYISSAFSLNDVIQYGFTGTAGNDTLAGTSVRDALDGGAGDDMLIGGLGADRLTGGAGNDTFLGTTTELNGDTITDFSVGDRIHVTDQTYPGFTLQRAVGAVSFGGATVQLPTGARLALQQSGGGTDVIAASHMAGLSDFNGDGHSDILWQNVSGTVSEWTVGGNSLSDQLHTGVFGSPVPAGWSVSESFDMNGDGLADLLWRNPSGAVSVWDGAGGGLFQAGAYNSTSVPADWKVAATADFDGDGKDDILWRQDGGGVSLWSSAGTLFQAGAYNTNIPTDWKIEGAGDFNGDGKADILWRNDNGTISTWQSTSTGFQTGAYNASGVPTSWHVRGIADFNGDGKDDIVWLSDSGSLSVWFSNGNGFDTGKINDSLPKGWSIAAVGDYNDDGNADILWRSDTGATSIWDNNSTSTGFIKGVANANIPTAWHVVAHEFLL